jgi:hypothetical protein
MVETQKVASGSQEIVEEMVMSELNHKGFVSSKLKKC